MGDWADDFVEHLLDGKAFHNVGKFKHNRNNRKGTNELLIQGKGKWSKIIGEPIWGFEKKHREWSIDVFIDEETAHKLEVEGLKEKIKDKGDGQYMTFKRRELKVDGSPNTPIRVVDHHGEPWNPRTKIGNGSVVNVNFAINEYGKNQKSANILSLQVWDLVPYEGAEFPTREDDTTASEGDWEKEVA